MPICAQCATENPEIAKFCLACGSALAAPEPPEEERRPVTAVFVDIVGSTSRAEQLDPEEVLALLEPYYKRLSAVLERFGGTVEKFIGDAVVALFGAPVAHGDDALRAVRAALCVLEAIDELNEEDPTRELAVRVGVNTGEAFVAMDARYGTGMAWGDMVNTAARIQSDAPVGGVLVGDETWRATRRAIEYRAHAPIEAKGKAQPVGVWEAVGAISKATAVPEHPLFGRDEELAALESVWRQVISENSPAVALVTGQAGIGKSRLVDELALQIEGACLRGHCLPYGEGMTYWPVIEVLKQAAGILQNDSPTEVAAKTDELLDRLPTTDLDELRTIAVAVSNLLGAGSTPRGTYSADEVTQAELHWGLRRVLELRALEGPLMVVIEDLQWAEPTLIELIRFVSESEAAAPVLILGSARPELGDVLVGATRLDLEPLSREASAEMLRGLLGDAPAELLERADGNPLFLEELAGAAADGGGGAVPATLQAVVGARLDSLDRGAKRVAQHASVCGTVFWPGAVAVLTATDDLEPSLAELERREFAREQPVSSVAGESEWNFKHIMIRDVAYGRLPRAVRAKLHERFAGWVAALGGGEGFVEIRAYHLEQACKLAKEGAPVAEAVAVLTAAGERSEHREGIREADRFYQRALELLPQDDDAAVHLRFQRARLVSAQGDHKAARAALLPIAEEAAERGLEWVRAHALLTLANVEGKLGLAAEARQRLPEAAAYADRAGDVQLAVRASFELADIHGWFDGDTRAAIGDLQAAAARADLGTERGLRVEAHLRLGALFFNAGRLKEAAEMLAEAAELADSLGSLRDQARAVSMLGTTLYFVGGCTEAEPELLRAEEWLARTEDAYLRIQCLRDLAKCALRDGRLDVAEERLQAALPGAVEAGGWLVVEIYRYLVETLLRSGRLEDALLVLALARSAVPPEDQYARAALRIAEGLTAAVGHEDATVRAAFEEALRILEEQEQHTDLAETRLVYARALGSPQELAEARKTFARIGANAFLAEIDAELASAPA